MAVSSSKTWMLLLSLSLLSACTPESKTLNATEVCDVSGDNFSIVGGKQLAPGNDLSSSTVLILDVNLSDETSICTGTLIADNIVLTAAHCKPSAFSTSVVVFSNSIPCATAQNVADVGRKVVAYTKHPSYRTRDNSSTYDLLLLKLEDKAPAGFYPRKLPQQDPQHLSTQNVVMAGYGITSEKSKDSGVLRYTTADATRLSRNSVTYTGYYGRKTESLSKTWALDQTQNNGVCSGDSGGPLYMKTPDGLVLIGVTSRGVDPNAADTDDQGRVCHGFTLFTDVFSHLGWIHEEMRNLQR